MMSSTFFLTLFAQLIVVYFVSNVAYLYYDGNYHEPDTLYGSQCKGSNHSSRFEFRNCNNTPVPVQFRDLGICPDPIVMENLSFRLAVKFDIHFTEDVGTHNQMEMDLSLKLQRGEDDYLELCEILGPKCFLGNVCQNLETECRGGFLDMCKCPFKKGNITRDYFPIVKPIESPPFLIKGTFVLRATVKEFGRPIACVEIRFCVNECLGDFGH